MASAPCARGATFGEGAIIRRFLHHALNHTNPGCGQGVRFPTPRLRLELFAFAPGASAALSEGNTRSGAPRLSPSCATNPQSVSCLPLNGCWAQLDADELMTAGQQRKRLPSLCTTTSSRYKCAYCVNRATPYSTITPRDSRCSALATARAAIRRDFSSALWA
eukprot:scaffold40430_cov65-Phaeocystis_antarctica.AAC.17